MLIQNNHNSEPSEHSSAIEEILESSGIPTKKDRNDKNNLREILESNYLGLDSVIANLSQLAANGKDEVRARAIDTALKLHKVLEPDQVQVPSITINIQSDGHNSIGTIPSILIPRQIGESSART